MEFVHSCAFCGSHRQAASAVMVAPSCSDCGCRLDAVERDEFERRLREQIVAVEEASRLTRVLVAIFAAAVLVAAARFGYASGGPMIALVSVGLAAYLLLPFLPERLRPGGPAR